MTTWQKLLLPAHTRAIVERGLDGVGGPVADAGDVVHLDDPTAILEAFGFADLGPYGPSPEHVDVLRFPQRPLMRLERPRRSGDRPWPTYDTGFLPADAVVPVWSLAYTRVPTGTELWRVRADGQQRALSVYGGPAQGWRGAKGYAPPVHLIGPRAQWHGLDLPAAFTNDEDVVELVAVGETPEGFELVRPRVSRRAVRVAECDRVFEVVLTATWNDVPVRILQRTGDETLVQLQTDDPDVAASVGATSIEPGVFEAVAPTGELAQGSGSTFELARS